MGRPWVLEDRPGRMPGDRGQGVGEVLERRQAPEWSEGGYQDILQAAPESRNCGGGSSLLDTSPLEPERIHDQVF